MKQFFKYMFATVAGIFLSIFLFLLLLAVIVGGIISSSSDEKYAKVEDNSILHITFENEIQDRSSNNPFENFDFNKFESRNPFGLNDILNNIEKAETDEKIRGIFIDLTRLKASMATTEEIRNALLEFKKSGKFILSYSESYGQNEYYLSSVADRMYLHPAGDMEVKGLSAQVSFFKEAMEKLDVDMQVIRHGKFKSAVEPFLRNDMSEANKQQLGLLINTIWDARVEKVAENRKISIESINNLADSLLINTAEDALKYRFVDSLKYEDEVMQELMALTDTEKEEDLKFMLLEKYTKAKGSNKKEDEEKDDDKSGSFSKDRIAVVYASGEIRSGESSVGVMGSETVAKAIRKARQDENVKGIVLRVNSPGGSALASDVIWREVVLAKAEKPIVVSMGDLAASGGYYISCAADRIFAQTSTITGSIGVFGLIPNMQGLFENNLGIHFDGVNTNTYADGLTVMRPMKAREREALQETVESIYEDFTSKVAQGRNIPQAEVDSIGQGRVWSGKDAIKIGLVDELGGLENAIESVAAMAEIEDYKIKELPEQEDPLEKLLKEFTGEAQSRWMSNEFGVGYKYYQKVKSISESRDIYMRIPMEIELY